MKAPIATNDPADWRRRSEEMRREADQLEDPETKEIMMDIARAFEQLADLVEKKRTSRPKN